MKITAAGRYGTMLTRLGFFNCFLVRDEDAYTLIDTNLKGSAPDILKVARDLHIRRIMLTHPHVDHIASADALAEELPGVEILASRRSIPLLQRPPDRSLRPGELGPIRGGTPGFRTKVTRTIDEGDRVGSLLVIDTPGHIHGHQSFLDERDGTLYAGDQFASFGRLVITGYTPWWFPLKAYSNREQARGTAEKLQGYSIRRFACGHGRLLEGGFELLREALARARD